MTRPLAFLADRHHAGLYHSLGLLFERVARVAGHDTANGPAAALYTPQGHEWWDQGYWRFGEGYGDDRLARQFLDWTGDEPYPHRTAESEFPDTPVWGMTLDEARAYPFDYVVATVQDNQHGMARFAREIGAQFVLAVGNTGQLIDWGQDPLVLNSSEMPIHGRGVNIGQEFDSDGVFAYEPISNATRIVSLANCMTSMPCWPLLAHAREAAPDLTFRIHGIDGPDGNLKPSTTIAAAIRGAGWGWHDKTHGDGFGHVIHSLAAVGRPLIGHASHYAGKRAEGLWVDGETCIDLDRHPITEALTMVREISSDPMRHNDMSVAIRRRFDELCDWDRDARLVADLLGLAVPA